MTTLQRLYRAVWFGFFIVLLIILTFRPSTQLGVSLVVILILGVSQVILDRIRQVERMVAAFLVKTNLEMAQLISGILDKRGEE